MANEWKVARVKGEDLEVTLQSLDADGFEIFQTHLESGAFVVVGRRPLAAGKKRRFYPFDRVALRASNGRLVETHGFGQVLRASATVHTEKSLFQMIRLEPSYGPDLVAFLQPGGLLITQADEHMTKPYVANGPELGGWQMFGLVQRPGNRVSLRTQDQKRFLRVEGPDGLIVAKDEPADKADLFSLEIIRASGVERIGVTLHW